jgi:ankyrin repeat protein
MATLYDVAHFCSWNGYPQDMREYLGIDKASWTNKEFWFPYGANVLYGPREKTRLQCICERIYDTNKEHILPRIKELLANGAKPDIKDIEGFSALSVCARQGSATHLEILKILLNAGANINQKTIDDGNSPLHFAVYNNHFAIMKELVKRGADINQQDKDGDTPLSCATLDNNIDIVKELLNNGANPHINDINGSSLLHYCAQHGYFELMKILLNAGVDINQQTNIGDSPLSTALYYNKFDIAKELCERGANIYTTDIHGVTPICFPTRKGHLGIVKYLHKHGAIIVENTIQAAIYNGRINVLKYFSKLGLNAHIDSIYNAVKFNKPKLINLLSKMGGNLNYISDFGNTPLSLALATKSYECIKALCKLGANMNMVDIRSNFLPIQSSLIRGDYKALTILINNGVSVNTMIHDSPLLHYGILFMDMNTVDDKFKTCVKVIIKAGPDFTLLDRQGEDAAEYARGLGYLDIVARIKRAEKAQ